MDERRQQIIARALIAGALIVMAGSIALAAWGAP